MPIDSRCFRSLLSGRRSLFIALAFFLLMTAVGAIPGEANALAEIIPDKLSHFVAYAFISVLLFAGIAGSPIRRAWRTMLGVALLGLLDEAIQELMPYRNADLRDWQVDLLAAACASGTMAWRARLSRVAAHPQNGADAVRPRD
jgi:VanZ family protein